MSFRPSYSTTSPRNGWFSSCCTFAMETKALAHSKLLACAVVIFTYDAVRDAWMDLWFAWIKLRNEDTWFSTRWRWFWSSGDFLLNTLNRLRRVASSDIKVNDEITEDFLMCVILRKLYYQSGLNILKHSMSTSQIAFQIVSTSARCRRFWKGCCTDGSRVRNDAGLIWKAIWVHFHWLLTNSKWWLHNLFYNSNWLFM